MLPTPARARAAADMHDPRCVSSRGVCGPQATADMCVGSAPPSAASTAFLNRRLTALLSCVHPGVDTAEVQRIVRLLGAVRRRRCPPGAGWATAGSPPGDWSCHARNLRGRRHRHCGRGAGGRVVQGAGGLRAINRLCRPGASGPDRRRRVQLLLPAGGVLQAVAQGTGAGARTRCVGGTGGGDSRPKAPAGPLPFLLLGGRASALSSRRPRSRCLDSQRGAPKTRDTPHGSCRHAFVRVGCAWG